MAWEDFKFTYRPRSRPGKMDRIEIIVVNPRNGITERCGWILLKNGTWEFVSCSDPILTHSFGGYKYPIAKVKALNAKADVGGDPTLTEVWKGGQRIEIAKG